MNRTTVLLCFIAVALGCSKQEANVASSLQSARSAALFDKAEKAQDETHQRNMRIIERTEALLATQETMQKRQQDDFARMEHVLDTWEKQQAQYQRYLDTLPSKK
jgi:hypothetical protein